MFGPSGYAWSSFADKSPTQTSTAWKQRDIPATPSASSVMLSAGGCREK